MTGRSAAPRAGTAPTGSVQAIATPTAAAVRIAVPQMTVVTRQARRNAGT